jgi:hypothetical protein
MWHWLAMPAGPQRRFRGTPKTRSGPNDERRYSGFDIRASFVPGAPGCFVIRHQAGGPALAKLAWPTLQDELTKVFILSYFFQPLFDIGRVDRHAARLAVGRVEAQVFQQALHDRI